MYVVSHWDLKMGVRRVQESEPINIKQNAHLMN